MKHTKQCIFLLVHVAFLVWYCGPRSITFQIFQIHHVNDRKSHTFFTLRGYHNQIFQSCQRIVSGTILDLWENGNIWMILKSLPWLLIYFYFLNGNIPQNSKLMTSPRLWHFLFFFYNNIFLRCLMDTSGSLHVKLNSFSSKHLFFLLYYEVTTFCWNI